MSLDLARAGSSRGCLRLVRLELDRVVGLRWTIVPTILLAVVQLDRVPAGCSRSISSAMAVNFSRSVR